MTPNQIAGRALQIAQEEMARASPEHRAAFANSVSYLVTGASGGCVDLGGPSVRECAVAHLYAGRAGSFTFEEAVELLIAADGLVFGPIGEIHCICWESELCFDDDPADITLLNQGVV